MSRDYLMDDITSSMPNPKPIVPGTKMGPWRNTNTPFTKEQALEVLQAGAVGVWLSPGMCARVHHCLTADAIQPPTPQTSFGSHLGGWAFLDVDGWRGGYETNLEATGAWYEQLAAKERT